MNRFFVPEGHFLHRGALLSEEDAARYLPPGTYLARGRAGAGPVQDVVVTVSAGGTAEIRPAPRRLGAPA